jgi:hypothetical protein
MVGLKKASYIIVGCPQGSTTRLSRPERHDRRNAVKVEGRNMKLIRAAVGIAALCAVGVSAQVSEVRSKTTKIEVSDGKEITTSGCVQRAGDDFYLMPVGGGATQYRLVGRDFQKYVGHRVEVNGKATDLGDAKVKTETTAKVEVEHGKDREVHTKVESKGDIAGLPLLGVKSLKTLASSCS